MMLPGRSSLPREFLPPEGPPDVWNWILTPIHPANDLGWFSRFCSIFRVPGMSVVEEAL